MEVKQESTSKSGSKGFFWFLIGIALLIVVIVSMNTTKTAPQTQTQSQTQAQTQAQTQSAPPPAATDGHSIYGPPSLSADQVNTILAAYHSPAAGQGQMLYDMSTQYGIDDAYSLAFFLHESSMGTQGEARVTHSLGNLRCIPDAECIDQDRGGYACFANWHDGFQAWFVLITGSLYKGDGLTTVEAIIPRYAPTADNNDEQAYMDALINTVQAWQAGKVLV